MKILAVSDLHSSNEGARAIHKAVASHEPDLTLVCGDITHYGPLGWAKSFLEGLRGEILALPGNCDPPQMTSLLEDMGVSLHGRKTVVDDSVLVGLGGSSPTPFNTLYEISEEEITRALSPLMEPSVILVTHDAPRGRLDLVPGKGSVGSVAIRETVDKFMPILSIFGHLHESAGVQRDKTVFVNVGGGMFGRYAVIETETLEVTMN